MIDLGSHMVSCVLVHIIAGRKNTLSENRAACLINELYGADSFFINSFCRMCLYIPKTYRIWGSVTSGIKLYSPEKLNQWFRQKCSFHLEKKTVPLKPETMVDYTELYPSRETSFTFFIMYIFKSFLPIPSFQTAQPLHWPVFIVSVFCVVGLIYWKLAFFICIFVTVSTDEITVGRLRIPLWFTASNG
jgi:hypothetical protein